MIMILKCLKILFSDGYAENYHEDTAAAISQATQASLKNSSRRISVTLNKKDGLNVSVEDLRRRKTKIVVVGHRNVGKSGNLFLAPI